MPADNAGTLAFPNCDIYYNRNQTHDRQIAGFGEVSYSISERWKLTAGGRWAKMSFDLSHYADGYENYGPGPKSASEKENAFTPKVGISFQQDPNNLWYATYAKGFRPGGGNAPLPDFCGPGPDRRGLRQRPGAAHVQLRLHPKLRDRQQEQFR